MMVMFAAGVMLTNGLFAFQAIVAKRSGYEVAFNAFISGGAFVILVRRLITGDWS